ncbi:MAG: CDP-glucose 4,6-dehydratase [Magnetococcus sp. WYHC-3]
MQIDSRFWSGKRVFLTGHTGFKGSWLILLLDSLGAQVYGYALDPPTDPSLFRLAGLGALIAQSTTADVRDLDTLNAAMARAHPDIVIHMAAQPLVRDSYQIPVETYATNVMGTAHVMQSVRNCESVRVVINVTTDKCYENREWPWGYREIEPLGGHDPYSSSKACSELVGHAFQRSFFAPGGHVNLASARAGNVIGGGDWAKDRLVPDCLRALLHGETIVLRNPHAIRPWQHVLEPLSGYLMLAQQLWHSGPAFVGGWNFGPSDADAQPVESVVRQLCALWGSDAGYRVDGGFHVHEASYLKLDCSKAASALGWRPRWTLSKALEMIVRWARGQQAGEPLDHLTRTQIQAFLNDGS